MAHCTQKTAGVEGDQTFDPDSIERAMRAWIREVIQRVVEEELEVVLGAAKSRRVGLQRRG